MPQRALLKIKRNQIPVYDLQKKDETRLECSVENAYLSKLFTIYPPTASGAFTVTDLGARGIGKRLSAISKRLGLLLGVTLFCIGTVFAQQFVFSVEFVGTEVYRREALSALEENGFKPFTVYQTGKEDLVCARLLSIPDVEFCSVQKVGTRLRVEMRLHTLPPPKLQTGDMFSKRTGTVLSITALKGTLAKGVGDKIERGETLVHSWYFVEGRGQVSVEVIARASIACVYEQEITATDEAEAFAKAYLQLDLKDGDKLTGKRIEKTKNGFFVRIEYTAIESMNL